MSFFAEPVHSSHIPSVHVPNAGLGSVGEVATQEDWPMWARSTALQGMPTGTGNPWVPTASLAVASIPTASFGTSFFPAAGLSHDGDTSVTALAGDAAPPTLNQAGGDIFSNKLFIGAALLAGTFLALSMLGRK